MGVNPHRVIVSWNVKLKMFYMSWTKYKHNFLSNIAKKLIEWKFFLEEIFHATLKILFFHLTRTNSNIQYVGETALPLHKRINIHRNSKSGCKHIIKHFRNDCARSSFTIQILEILPGTEYKNNKICPVERVKRLKREDYWMKTLRTIYPYDLFERARKKQWRTIWKPILFYT